MASQLHIHYLQHVPHEGLGCIHEWIQQKGHTLSRTFLFDSPDFPNPETVDWLIVMGGPMGAYDEEVYSWLRPEKDFIRNCIDAGKRVLGICLGSQLVAEVLGGRVYPNGHKEIGWFPVIRTLHAQESAFEGILPEHFTAFHWHGDTFDLPANTINLAYSEACTQQAYLYDNRVLGLQFHVEMTLPALKDMLHHGKDELAEAPFIQSEERILAETGYLKKGNTLMHNILNWMEALDIRQQEERLTMTGEE